MHPEIRPGPHSASGKAETGYGLELSPKGPCDQRLVARLRGGGTLKRWAVEESETTGEVQSRMDSGALALLSVSLYFLVPMR